MIQVSSFRSTNLLNNLQRTPDEQIESVKEYQNLDESGNLAYQNEISARSKVTGVTRLLKKTIQATVGKTAKRKIPPNTKINEVRENTVKNTNAKPITWKQTELSWIRDRESVFLCANKFIDNSLHKSL